MTRSTPDPHEGTDRASLRLRLIAPLQSWGVSSMFDTATRPTNRAAAA